MKRHIPWGLMLTLVFIVVGCGNHPSTSSKTESPGVQPSQAPTHAWVRVIALRGDGTPTSAVFGLRGGSQKIIYGQNGSAIQLTIANVVGSHATTLKYGARTAVSDSLLLPTGRYTIKVTCAGTWSLALFELR
jgi:hypothetical protein